MNKLSFLHDGSLSQKKLEVITARQSTNRRKDNNKGTWQEIHGQMGVEINTKEITTHLRKRSILRKIQIAAEKANN